MRTALLSLLLTVLPTSMAAAQGSDTAAEAANKLRFAASQHEIIAILLEEGQYSEVLLEFGKILELGLTGRNEKPVVQEAWLIVDNLRGAGEYELAHQVVDNALSTVGLQESEFYLLMLRGKIYQDQGMTDQAIETYRRAQELNPEN